MPSRSRSASTPCRWQPNAARVVVVANRVTGERDHHDIASAFADQQIAAVPDDPTIGIADQTGRAPLDTAPDGPAVTALRTLASQLGGR